jgi:hypothetical protein
MSCELRGAMSNGHLKLTDDKIVFQHSKSGKKDVVRVSRIKHAKRSVLYGRYRI